MTSPRQCEVIETSTTFQELLRCATLMCEPRHQIANSPEAHTAPISPALGSLGQYGG